jgi:hypothetical protein
MIADIKAEGEADQKKHDWCNTEQTTNTESKTEKATKATALEADIEANNQKIVGKETKVGD